MDVGSSKSNISTDLVNKIIFDSGTIETGSTAPNLATKADSFSQLLQTETAQTNKISLVQLLVFQKVNKENLSISSDLVNPAAQSEASSSVKSENIVDEPTNNLTEIIVQKDIQLPVNSKNELNQNLINKLFFSEKFVNNNNIQGIPDSFKIGNLVNLDSVYLNFNSENIANVNELNAAIEALVNSKSSQKEPLEGLGKIINQIEKNVIGSKNSSNKFDLAKLIASFEALSGQAETVSDPDVKENNEKAKYINSGKTDQSDALKLVPDALVAITENTNGIKAFKTEISNSDNDQLISLTTISQSTKPAAKAIEGISAKVYPENIKAITDKPTKEPITEDLPKMAAGAEQKVSIEVKFVENQTVTEKPATEPITEDLPKMAAGAEQKVSIEVKSVENQTVTEKPATEPITEDLPKMAAGAEQKVSIEVKSVENQTVTEKPATEPITDDLPKVAAGGLKLKKKEIISDNKARTIVESSDLKSEEKPIKNDQSLKNQVEENLVPSESIAATLTVVPQTVSQMNQIDDLLANNGEQNPENTYEPIPYQKFQKAIVDQQNAYLGFSGSKRISGGILTNKLSGSVNDLTNVGQNISNDETDQITKNKDPKAVINKNNLNSIPQELRTDQGISNINNPINDSKKLILTDNKNLNFGTILPFDKDVIKIKINTLNGNKSSVAADNDLNLLFNLTQRNSKSINIIDPKILGNSPDSLINLNENSFVKSSIDQPPAEHNSLSININLLKKELANQNNSTESVLIDNTVKNIDNLKFEQLSQTSIQSQDKAIDQLLGQTKTNKDNSDSIINPTIKLLGSESSNLDDNINLIKKDGEYSSFKNQTDYSNKNDSTEQNKNFEIKPDINLIKLNELSNSAKGQSISLATGKNPAPNVKEYLKDDKSNDYKIITKTDQSAEPSKNQSKNESNTNFFKNEQGRSLEQPNPLDNIVNKEDIKNSQDGKIEKIIVNNQENTVRINLNELNNTIRSYASSMTNGTSYQAKIILNPESLGTVFVEMSLKGNVVDINIKAETKEAVMNIRQQINDLKEKLAGNGLQSDKIEVELKDSWQDESNSKNRRNGLSQDDEKARKDFVKSFQNLKEENK